MQEALVALSASVKITTSGPTGSSAPQLLLWSLTFPRSCFTTHPYPARICQRLYESEQGGLILCYMTAVRELQSKCSAMDLNPSLVHVIPGY